MIDTNSILLNSISPIGDRLGGAMGFLTVFTGLFSVFCYAGMRRVYIKYRNNSPNPITRSPFAVSEYKETTDNKNKNNK